MKSGHCLIKNDEQLKSIESEFDAKGRIQGFVKIDYFNNTRILGHCVDGVLHGITRWAILQIFKFSNSIFFFFLQKTYFKKIHAISICHKFSGHASTNKYMISTFFMFRSRKNDI